jgi:Arc/MetJ-type ribon-helix-helix transcriptional regulator
MTTLSVPINAELEEFINDQIADGKAANKADVVRKALLHYSEEQAFMDVLEAEADVEAGRVYEFKNPKDFKKVLQKIK